MITEKSKQRLRNSFLEEKMKLEQECQQLFFEQKKLTQQIRQSKQEIEERFQREVNRRQEKIKLLDFKMDQLQTLALGSEIVEREVEALVEVKEGMCWDDICKERSIVIKDGVIVRIDE